MKIGIWAKCLDIEQKTGLEVYTESLIRGLAKIDSKNDYLLYSDHPLETGYLPKNFKLKVLPWPFPKLWTQIRLPWELASSKPNLIFFPSFASPLLLPVKSVITIHDLFVFDFPQHYSLMERLTFSFWVNQTALKGASAIIVPSEYIKNLMTKKWPDFENKIFVTHLGYNPEYRPRPVQEIERVKRQHKLKTAYFIHVVGGYVARKNSLRVLEAFKTLNPAQKNITMVFVGRDFGPEYQKTQKAVCDLGLKKLVFFLKYLPTADLAALLCGAIASVYPSLSEGFGLPVLEAMACGVPVVTSNLGAMAEVAGQAALLVNPHNIAGIAKAMETFWKDARLRKKYQTLGLERTKHFSWQKCAQETLKIFETVGAK